ncbi:MAG: YsnF/AvaK domain-containing protein [Candidatus Sulfotelmatobacter sp.]
MATRNLASNLDNTTNRVVAFFSRREDAYRALSDLKQAGFNSDQIGLAVGHEGEISGNATSTREYDSSFWQKVKDFFSGEDHHEHTDFGEVASPMGWTDDRYEYYQRGISTGGAVVTVTGDRISEARTILQRDGADLRQSGFESDSSARSMRAASGVSGTQGDRRIQLRGEMLRTHKERVQRGEARLRKDVVTENQNIQVPVTREELVIERTPGSGQVTGEIGRDEEIRVPLSEERVRVEKQPVVNEEVRVGKRQVQSNKEVSDKVRHEELRVEKKGDVDAPETNAPANRKNRVA